MKSVVFVIPNLGGGGAERALVNLLARLDLEHTSPCCIFHNAEHQYELPYEMPTYNLDLWGQANWKKRVSKIRSILDDVKPDAVVSFLATVNVEVALASEAYPLIVSERNLSSIILAGDTHHRKRWLMRRFYPRLRKVIAVSDAVRRELIDWLGLPGDNIEVIRNGVDVERVRELAKQPVEHPWFEDGVPVIVSLGRLISKKGHKYLVEAMKDAPGRLLILGQGAEEANLRQQISQLELDERIQLLPFQNNPFPYLARASLMAHPSSCEGLPNSVLEGVACGLPVVASSWAGADECVIDGVTGTIVPARDSTALAIAIRELLEDDEKRRRYADATREFVEEFNLDSVAERYQALWR